jgi:hypothetical protein
VRISVASREVGATQARGLASNHERANAHPVTPTTDHEMGLVITQQMISDHSIEFGLITGHNGEIWLHAFGLGPVAQREQRGPAVGER